MSALYMLNSVGERMPPCGTPVLNGRCEDVLFRYVVSLDVVCDEVNNCAWNVGL